MDQYSNKPYERLLHSIDHLGEQPSGEHKDPEETHTRPTIHVYLTDEAEEPEQPEEARTIESTIEHTTAGMHSPGTKTVPHVPCSRRRTICITVLLLCLLIVGGSVIWSFMALWTPQAMITLVPVTTEISATSSVTLTTIGTATENYVPGRLLSSLTVSQQQSISTTGRDHQEARAAQGMIMFYNALPQAQTIPAGQRLNESSGIQIVTDQEAVIPASMMLTEGQVTVLAHAVQIGPRGNIPSGTIYGACCLADIFATNHAFSGGQAARSYSMVTQHDIDSAVTSLTTTLEQSEQAASQSQVHPDERLLTPLACTPQVTTDKQVGEEASTVTVTLDEHCRAVTYNAQAMHTLITQSLNQQASKQLGTSYQLIGDIQTQISSAQQQQHATIALHVQGRGTYAYQFSEHAFTHMRRLIAGKSEMQAKALLLHTPGVRSVSFTMPGNQTVKFPTDTKQIRFLVIEPSSPNKAGK